MYRAQRKSLLFCIERMLAGLGQRWIAPKVGPPVDVVLTLLHGSGCCGHRTRELDGWLRVTKVKHNFSGTIS
jgi:hypothetical protein